MNNIFKLQNLRTKSLVFPALFAGLLVPMTAQAQIDEIVVTARKKAESSQDVPIAITALPAQEIEKFGINDVYDLRGAVPSLEVRRPTAFGNPVFTIRGVGSTNFDTISGAVVAPYFDDVPIVSVGQLNFTTFDLETIEVLKGPQGTLFGTGTTAGVVQFRSKRPTFDFEAYSKIEAANYGLFAAEGAISGPLAENVAGRLSVRGETFDGYYENLATGKSAGGQDAIQVRGQILYEGDQTSVLAGAYYNQSRGSSTLYDIIPLLQDDGTGVAETCGPVQAALDRGRFTQADAELARAQCVDIFGEGTFAGDEPYTDSTLNTFDNDIPIDLTTFGFNVRADIGVGDKTFTSISGFNSTEHGGVDPESAGRAGAGDVLWITDVLALSQEFRLSSDPSATNPWIVGFNIVANEIENDLQSVFTGSSFGAEGTPIITETPAETLASVIQYSAPQEQDTIEGGVFGQVDWRLSDRLRAVTGARGQWYRKEGTVSSPGIFDITNTVLEESGFAFNLGLNYDVGDNALLYGKISQGIKSGSHSGGFIFSADNAVGAEQETLLSYEVGLKSQFADNTIQFNASAFFYDYQDLQAVTQILVGQTFLQRYSNIGDAEVLGAEAEVTWAPNENLILRAAGTLLDTEIVSVNEGVTAATFVGNELSTAPTLQASWLARYTFPEMANGYGIAVQYDGNHAGDQFRDVINDPLGFDEATTKHNANISLLSPNDSWELNAYVRNFTDELDFTWQFNFGGAQRRSYLQPRTYGISLTNRF